MSRHALRPDRVRSWTRMIDALRENRPSVVVAALAGALDVHS